MEMVSPLAMALCSPLGACAAEGAALQCFGSGGVLETPRGFVRWGTPGGEGAAPAGRANEWWTAPPSATTCASGWTPIVAAMQRAARASQPPFLRDRLGADLAAEGDADNALARWGSASSASTQARGRPAVAAGTSGACARF